MLFQSFVARYLGLPIQNVWLYPPLFKTMVNFVRSVYDWEWQWVFLTRRNQEKVALKNIYKSNISLHHHLYVESFVHIVHLPHPVLTFFNWLVKKLVVLHSNVKFISLQASSLMLPNILFCIIFKKIKRIKKVFD